MDCNFPNSLDRPVATPALFTLIAFSAFLASCALPPHNQYDKYTIDQSLLPDGLRAKLQEEYPRHRVGSASIEVVRERAPSYSIELVSGTGKTLTHREVMEGRARPRVSFEDRNGDGVIDLEARRLSTPGSRRDWIAFDDNYDGFYDRQRWLGAFPWNVPVHIPVSSPVAPATPIPDPVAPRE